MNIEIANRALIKIGENPISSFNPEPLGEILEIVYKDVRQRLLATYPWRFAIRRVVLAPLEEKSLHPRFKYKYVLPSDCLLFRSICECNKGADLREFRATNGTRYEIEGKNIYYNEDSLPISYIADVDEELYSVLFKDAFANKLASELSIKVHQHLNLVQLYDIKFEESIQRAITHNEIIADTEELPDNTWVAVREGWNIGY